MTLIGIRTDDVIEEKNVYNYIVYNPSTTDAIPDTDHPEYIDDHSAKIEANAFKVGVSTYILNEDGTKSADSSLATAYFNELHIGGGYKTEEELANLAEGQSGGLTIYSDGNIKTNGNDVPFPAQSPTPARMAAPMQRTQSTQEDFTGQHRCVSDSIEYSNDKNGMIVIAADKGYRHIGSRSENTINNILISESLPLVDISTQFQDKRVFGVIGGQDSGRIVVNSIGEGAIWVCNAAGNLQNGDYITSSTIPGMGIKQQEDTLMNYTVAKITMDCSFDDTTKTVEFEYERNVYKKSFVGCTYHCG